MSDKQPQESQNEEVDLGQLFNAIGRLFEKLFSFIGKIFKGLFVALIFALKPFVDNFKLVAIILMVSALIGFSIEKFKAPIYVSEMLVKPFYDSKYQLTNNIDYFNALISSENYAELSNIFEIDSSTTAKELIGFEIEIGPETQYDLIKEFDEYKKSIDTTLAGTLNFEDYVEKRDLLSGSVFAVKAKAISNDIFPKLEKGFIKTLENEYTIKLKQRTDSIRDVQRQSYLQELARIDNLQKTYLEIKRNESEKNEAKLGTEGLIPLIQEKTETKEFELFQEELKIRKSLILLEEEALEESVYYDILSSFEKVGEPEKSLFGNYSTLFPLLALVIMILIYTSLKAFKYIKEYE